VFYSVAFDVSIVDLCVSVFYTLLSIMLCVCVCVPFRLIPFWLLWRRCHGPCGIVVSQKGGCSVDTLLRGQKSGSRMSRRKK
jgi:hypothetical protein